MSRLRRTSRCPDYRNPLRSRNVFPPRMCDRVQNAKNSIDQFRDEVQTIIFRFAWSEILDSPRCTPEHTLRFQPRIPPQPGRTHYPPKRPTRT